ncbi:MAG: hypothetical protein GEU80_17025 [Dehalococcoidia bacterium]|nr:hypothetical protein [Dehalococcoidia bacterium]
MSEEMSQARQIDPGAILDRVMRLSRLDTSVFDEVRDREGETIPALIVMAVSIFLSSLGGFLWVMVEFDTDDAGWYLTRMVLLGTVFSIGLWLAWALIVQAIVAGANVTVDRMAVVRCMGYAAAPAALMVLMLVPTLSFGIALVAVVAWFVLTNYAIAAAAPGASVSQVLRANLAGFAVWAIVLAILADQEYWASGIFAH